MIQTASVLGGAILGGFLGHFGFGWLKTHGYYAMVLPGGLLGLGAGLVQCRSRWPSIVCGLMALALSLFTEWRFFPFNADGSVTYFLQHLHKLESISLLMIAAGTAIGFWVPFRRVQSDRAPDPKGS